MLQPFVNVLGNSQSSVPFLEKVRSNTDHESLNSPKKLKLYSTLKPFYSGSHANTAFG